MLAHDPLMCPQRYHLWRSRFEEHGLQGAGDYWYDGRGRCYTFAGAAQRVALAELPETIHRFAVTIAEGFGQIAKRIAPDIERFTREFERLGALRPLDEIGDLDGLEEVELRARRILEVEEGRGQG